MRKTILVAGSAGSGVKFVSDKIIPALFLNSSLEASSNLSYSAAQRKGHVVSNIVIGGGSQHYYADIILALNQEGFDSVKDRIKDSTIIVYDSKIKSSILKKAKKSVPFTSESLYNNFVGTGALFKILGVKEEQKEKLKEVIKEEIKKDVEKNLEQILNGFDQINYSTNILKNFGHKKSGIFKGYCLSGNEAAVWGSLMGGANFFTGYPITPSTEAMHEWARIHHEFGAAFKQANSEEQAIGFLLGAYAKGAKAWTATSGPGLTRMLEQIGYGSASQTPFVIYNVQRGGPSTGLPTQTQQSDLITTIKGAHGDYPIIVLSPSNAQQTFDLMNLSFKLANKYKLGVIINSSKETGQRRSIVKLNPKDYDNIDYSLEDIKLRNRTGMTSNKEGQPRRDPKTTIQWFNQMFKKFEKDYDSLSMAVFENIKFVDKNGPYKARNKPPKDFAKKRFKPAKIIEAPKEVYIGYGENIPVMKELAKKNGKGMIGLLTLHPYPIKLIKQLNSLGVEKIISVELNRGSKVHEEQGQLTPKIRQYFKGEVEIIQEYDGQPLFVDKILENG